MEAIEYLRGEENQELNNIIILIVKEFLLFYFSKSLRDYNFKKSIL